MKLRGRFFIEAGSAAAFALLFALTLVRPDWIELIFGFAPDEGSGETEWGFVVALGAIAVVCLAIARVEWRRAQRLGNQAAS